ncbi:MAG: phosphoribosyl transferase [Chloroflexi bacterium]|nr:phosphoribosyl transferase [Chloroflexota bacterium]
MHHSGITAMFENRYDAGRQLADKLTDYKGKSVIVLAIPNGGVPVALGIALALEASEFNLIISRKIPLPLTPEAGFGAVTDDGAVMLNEELVREAGLTAAQIGYQVDKVRASILQRSLAYRKELPPPVIAGKTVVIVDDGLASGYTMMAAVKSVRARRPREVIAATPVASGPAAGKVEITAKLVTCAVGNSSRFYVADYYRLWNEPNDAEVLQCFKEWRLRRQPAIITGRTARNQDRPYPRQR